MNYQKQLEEVIKQNENNRKKLLLHNISVPTNEHMEMLLQTALQTGIKAQIGG